MEESEGLEATALGPHKPRANPIISMDCVATVCPKPGNATGTRVSMIRERRQSFFGSLAYIAVFLAAPFP